MLDTLAWPSGLAPKTVTLRQRGQALVGPPSLTGRTQVVQSDAGFWEVVLQGIPLGGIADVLAWRAFLMSMEGGARSAYVPAFDYDQAPWASAGGRSANETTDQAFSDATLFDDGHGFYNPAIMVTLAANAAARDTSITVTVTTAGTIYPGMVFSLLGERLHVIREKTSTTVWSIWPPLRRAYVAGINLEFARPTLKALLATPNDGELPLAYGRMGSADAVFRELIT